MSNKLKIEDLTGVKLVQEDNYPPLYEVQAMLDHAYSQGSQGWGVKRDVAVVLFLAKELLEAKQIAETADENFRMLKGAQMETGRLKKKIEKLEAELLASNIEKAEVMADNVTLRETLEAVDQLPGVDEQSE